MARDTRPWSIWDNRRQEETDRARSLNDARDKLRGVGSWGRKLTVHDAEGRIAEIWEDGRKVA
ncbi:hypothetical protein [Nocardiopsis tropica]|uniref:Uncharacterized protein n=1 Tax=Nocardiopsis tropica TaxID=109330 RepID=A0ABU7KQZ7_9ACTN|nr:hypothetical protein [Nocardiopsis umidischolae]MEE2051736.1 hypothetical protein [Nocardiopsis umidischolae]